MYEEARRLESQWCMWKPDCGRTSVMQKKTEVEARKCYTFNQDAWNEYHLCSTPAPCAPHVGAWRFMPEFTVPDTLVL